MSMFMSLLSDNNKQYILDGLFVYYDGENNTGDGHNSSSTSWKNLVGDNYNGVLYGGTWYDNYLYLDGVNDYVQALSNQSLLGNKFTIEMTIQTDLNVNCRGLFGGHNLTPGIVGGQYLNGTIEFGIHSGYFANTIPYTNWLKTKQHITWVVDGIGKFFKLYINGVLVSTANQSNTLTSLGTDKFIIGRAYNLNNRYMVGNVYDTLIYTRPLTDIEVLNNYNTSKAKFGI